MKRHFYLVFLAVCLACTACGKKDKNENNGTDNNLTVNDMDIDSDAGGDASMSDMGNADAENNRPSTDEVVVSCGNVFAAPASGLCDAAPGSADGVLFQVGTVLTPEAVYENGTVLISGTGGDATISCVGCDCADEARGATIVTCANGALSASFINPHDHITFSLSWPQQHGTERFDHRHDWRRGIRGHSDIGTSPGRDSSREGVLYGELRMLMGGATSVAGSSSSTDASGLIRNLDAAAHLEGLTDIDVDYRTFPLGDSDATLLDAGCNYPNVDDATRAANAGIYLPHIAEGIDAEANNEFRCLSDTMGGAVDLIGQNTSIIHGIGLTTTDIASVAADGAKLVWSPRSNIDLYGMTARVPTYKNFGVTIALGTDWSASGSMNMLRELRCADHLNATHFNETFTDRELWMMATYNAAVAMGADTQIGVIAERYVADIALFDGSVGSNYRAVLDADTQNVHLVLRGGAPLYGDANIIEALVPAAEVDQCETVDVCGNDRRLCLQRDAGITLGGLRGAVDQNAYPLFFCDTPDREPSCEPLRDGEFMGPAADDADGDGLADGEDLCPDLFTPVRPMDGNEQTNFDSDGLGDDCDACPLSPEDDCPALDPNDRDADGVTNLEDNCPSDPNADQANADGDPFGDVCDPCPDFDNSASLACPTTIYEIRGGVFGPGDTVALDEVIVTAVSDRAFFLQVDPGASYYTGVEQSGLYVFAGTGGTLPAVGDILSLEGRLDIFGDTLELVSLANINVMGQGTVPDFTDVTAAEVSTGGARAADLEATLVRLRDVTVTSSNPDAPDDFGEFEVDGLRVDDLLHAVMPHPTVGSEFAILQGALTFSFGNSKLLPRGPTDVVTGPPSLDSIQPGAAFLRTGTTGPTEPPLRVEMTGPALGATVVNLSYSGNVSGPASVTIPDAASGANIDLTAAGTGTGTVTASYMGDMSAATVTVYDDSGARAVTSLTPSTATVPVNGAITLTVGIDVPAPSAGQVVALTYTSGVSGPVSTTVPADRLTTTIDVTTGPDPGSESVLASIGGSMQQSDITVTAGSPNCLIFSEVIEGSGSNNKAFEIYNCSPGDLQLSDFAVCLVSNANTTCSATMGLPSMNLPTGAVFTMCRSMVAGGGDPVDDIANNCQLEASGVANFNGNDRLVLFRDVDGNDALGGADEIVDAFGELAVDPGSIWANVTYRRCDFTQYDGTGAFDVAALYTEHPQNDATDFGMAPTEGCP